MLEYSTLQRKAIDITKMVAPILFFLSLFYMEEITNSLFEGARDTSLLIPFIIFLFLGLFVVSGFSVEQQKTGIDQHYPIIPVLHSGPSRKHKSCSISKHKHIPSWL